MSKPTFLLKLTIIIASLVLVDKTIGKLLSHYYHKIKNGEQGRLSYAIDSTTSPILIFGGSRAAHHYIPAMLSGTEAVYNTGKDKQDLYYDLAILTATLSRYKPKTLILDLAPDAFVFTQSGIDALAVLLPYYQQHPEIRPIVNKKSRWESWKTLSTLYCYNSLPLQIGKRTLSDVNDDKAVSGYVPKFDSLDTRQLEPYDAQQLTGYADAALVSAFLQFISLAQEQHCRLTVIVSPVYVPLSEGSRTIHLAEVICHDKNVPFLDYSHSPEFSGNPALFFDAIHLNDAGAQKFTRLVAKALSAE